MILPYTIDFTDNTDKPSFQIQPGQIDDTTTMLSLPGKGRVDYGELYNENLVHILENFASPTKPTNPTKGQLWYRTGEAPALMLCEGGDNWKQLMTTGNADRFHIPVVTALPTTDLVAGDVVYLKTVEKIHVCVELPNSSGVITKQWLAIATQEWCETQLVIECGTVNDWTV